FHCGTGGAPTSMIVTCTFERIGSSVFFKCQNFTLTSGSTPGNYIQSENLSAAGLLRFFPESYGQVLDCTRVEDNGVQSIGFAFYEYTGQTLNFYKNGAATNYTASSSVGLPNVANMSW